MERKFNRLHELAHQLACFEASDETPTLFELQDDTLSLVLQFVHQNPDRPESAKTVKFPPDWALEKTFLRRAAREFRSLEQLFHESDGERDDDGEENQDDSGSQNKDGSEERDDDGEREDRGIGELPVAHDGENPYASFNIGVEVEFLLDPRTESDVSDDICSFAQTVAVAYNDFAPKARDSHPQMCSIIESDTELQFTAWSLDEDVTIESPKEDAAPWGLELISPVLQFQRDSLWRDYIKFAWEFLSTEYKIITNESCGTHVHLSRPNGYSLHELKRICQSVVHFETSFEAILPEERLGNEYTKSNYMDNINLGHQGLSRRESIWKIEQLSSIEDVVRLMSPNNDKMFGWNFLNVLEPAIGTIEFRRGAGSTSSQDVFIYTEIAMSFLEAAVQLGGPEELEQVSATVGGLKWFISQAKLEQAPSLYNSSFLDIFFSGKDDDMFREPKPLGVLSAEKLEKLEKKREKDKRRTLAMAKKLPPFWN